MTSPTTTQALASAGPAATTTEEFLRFFPGHWVQYFDDWPRKDRKKAMATPQFDAEEARHKQEQGCGVFFSPNAFSSLRRVENLAQVQAAYIDLDLAREGDGTPPDQLQERLDRAFAALLGCQRPPHAIIRTKNGLQAVWRVEPVAPPEALTLFQETEERLIRHFRADPAAKDVTRVLRLPGFWHCKDPKQPFRCQLLHNHLTREPYRLADLRDAFSAREVQADRRVTGASESTGRKAWRDGLAGVPEGQRNQMAASIAGKLLAKLPEELWDTAAWGGLKEWNVRNPVPLPESELRTVLESIARRERSRRRGPTGSDGLADDQGRAAKAQADRLVALVADRGAVLFCDQFGEPHAHVPAGPGRRTCRQRGVEFREWLAQRLWEAEGRACATDVVSAVLNTLAGRTRFEGERIALECRVAWRDGAIWYDLADTCGRAVRVSADGWQVVDQPPILFRRFNHQLPQACPVRGRPLTALLPFVSLADARFNPLLLVYLVTCFVSDIPHPVAFFYGPQGAAKSTLCRLLRRLVDPSALEGLSLPSRDELPQVLFHHWFPVFDNVSALGGDLSDMLCRAVTGEGVSRRRLYSDDDDVIYHFRRCLCLNGINLAAARPDLLDRSILFPLERITESAQREESDVVREFNGLRPELLGAVFDALAKAMHLRPTLRSDALPRMADFAAWGGAVAEALGIGAGTFHALYRDNIREQHEEAIAECPAADAVVEFMSRRDEWTGTPTELLSELKSSSATGTRQPVRALPRYPNALTKQLNLLRTNLAQVGIRVDTARRTRKRRLLYLKKDACPPVRCGQGAAGSDDERRTGDGGVAAAPSPSISAEARAPGGPGDGGDGACWVVPSPGLS
jgi:hypothetical protein